MRQGNRTDPCATSQGHGDNIELNICNGPSSKPAVITWAGLRNQQNGTRCLPRIGADGFKPSYILTSPSPENCQHSVSPRTTTQKPGGQRRHNPLQGHITKAGACSPLWAARVSCVAVTVAAKVVSTAAIASPGKTKPYLTSYLGALFYSPWNASYRKPLKRNQ